MTGNDRPGRACAAQSEDDMVNKVRVTIAGAPYQTIGLLGLSVLRGTSAIVLAVCCEPTALSLVGKCSTIVGAAYLGSDRYYPPDF